MFLFNFAATQVLALPLHKYVAAHVEENTPYSDVKEVAKEIKLLEERIKITEDIICGRLCQNKLREMFNELENIATSFPASFH